MSETISAAKLMCQVRQERFRILRSAVRFLLRNFLNSKVRKTGHFAEWWRAPMNYVRLMEVPLTKLLLDVHPGERILDIGSPKLLALYYALQARNEVVATDLESYFREDFERYREAEKLPLRSELLDATNMAAVADASFDKVFSISVIEHIPHRGDSGAMREISRILKDGGMVVVTLPVAAVYTEEWVTDELYWESAYDDAGKRFFQRRYDERALQERIICEGLILEHLWLIAERPIKPLTIGADGRLQHNAYCLDDLPFPRFLNRISRVSWRIPAASYFAEATASRSCHYLTKDWSDPNIRQVALKLRRHIRPQNH